MKKILVPTDFSECALNALRVATKIAKKNKSTIYLVHVYDRPISGITLQFEIDNVKNKKIRNKIKDEMEKIAAFKFLKGVKLKRFIIPDKTIWEMLSHKNLKEVDLVVMGTHGSSGTNEFFIGSNAEKVVRSANKPVLCVKHRNDNINFSNIVFASDFSIEAIHAFPAVKKFAEVFNSNIHFLKINTPEKFETTGESKKEIDRFLKKVGYKDASVTIYNDFKKETGIIRYAYDIKADLIALGTHGRNGLSRFYNKSIAEGLVNHSSLPILTVNFSKIS